MYLKERLIIGMVWLICIVSIWYIPKNKRRDASVIFLIAQLFAWILGLIVVELGWIEYPVRLFAKANATSFSFEYFALPFMCVYFNIYYPHAKGLAKKVLYYISIMSSFTFLEYLAEKYTQILNYIHWAWYDTFISMCIVIYLVRVVYKWFFKLKTPLSF
ncbi:MAG: hypothetical protein K0R80_3482 [Clostridia bacterium]|jgi:hypothetical protein|nr:hypothetical protein [Clostridia bacterium]